MRNPEYSSIDTSNGNVSWNGPLSLERGDHSHMPSRTESYLPGDERGHINASSLGGGNSVNNVVPQHSDLNHGAYYSMEQGERTALQHGCSIDSSKTAIVNGQPGDRPVAFMVNDNITYPDGHMETINFSFTNESNATQQAWNDQVAALPGAYDAPNPGDGLRESMSSAEYAQLMEATDAELPGIADYYSPTTSAASDGVASLSSGEASDSIVAATETVCSKVSAECSISDMGV